VTGVAPVAATGTITSTLTKPATAFNGVPTGTIAATQKQLAVSLTGGQTFAATLAAALNPTNASLTGAMLPKGTISGLLGQPAALMSAGQRGPLAASLGKMSAALSGTASPTWLATGTGSGQVTSPTTSISWSDTIPAGTAVAVLWIADYAIGNTGMVATIGGTSATLTTSYPWGTDGAGGTYYIHCYTLLSPPTGSGKTIHFANGDTLNTVAPGGGIVYYNNVTSVGTPVTTNSAAAIASMSATSTSSNQMYVECFSYVSSTVGTTFSAYNQTQRYVAATDYNNPLLIGDSVGNGSTLTFSAHRTDTTFGWGGVIVPLSP
jgi:hypothetical protein